MFRMELQILLPVLSVLSSGVFHTGAVTLFPVETSATPSSERHSRTKRCSCATFLDKECVYFCHLDIIWVNTPERTVSYGLGNVARRKRSVAQAAGSELERCRCANNNDGTCAKFCHTDYPPRHKATPDKVIPPACGPDCAEKESKHDMAAQAQSVKRTWKSAAESSAAVQRIRLLLKKWRLRRLHKAQATWRQK